MQSFLEELIRLMESQQQKIAKTVNTETKLKPIQMLLLQHAKEHLGNKEISGNRGWASKTFQKAMSAAGWYMKAPWCAFFQLYLWKLVFAIVWPDDYMLQKRIKKLGSGSSKKLWFNYKESTDFNTGKIPAIGAVAIWNYGKIKGDIIKLGAHGHVDACVSEVYDAENFKSIGGNVNDRVSERVRDTRNHNNTIFLGFIYPPGISEETARIQLLISQQNKDRMTMEQNKDNPTLEGTR